MKDTAVQKTATLHEKTVQAVASGEVAPMPKRRRRGAQNGSPAVIESWQTQRHEMAMTAVKEILDSGHGYTTVEWLSEDKALVR